MTDSCKPQPKTPIIPTLYTATTRRILGQTLPYHLFLHVHAKRTMMQWSGAQHNAAQSKCRHDVCSCQPAPVCEAGRRHLVVDLGRGREGGREGTRVSSPVRASRRVLVPIVGVHAVMHVARSLLSAMLVLSGRNASGGRQRVEASISLRPASWQDVDCVGSR